MIQSPAKMIGGKSASAERIIAAFPAPSTYDMYVEVCAGALWVLLNKPQYGHIEVVNDLDNLLINFWLEVQAHGQEVQRQLSTRPYARKLYYDYWHSLYGSRTKHIEPDQSLSGTEKAVRWLYILRSNMTGYLRQSPPGWNYGNAEAMYNAAQLITVAQKRLQSVAIDNRDAVATIRRYSKSSMRIFFYVDPPYIKAEKYYPACRANGGFDHQALAEALNATPHMVALSYYPDPMLDELYPAAKWRRVTWQQHKPSNISENSQQLDMATEVLLMNYESRAVSLWEGVA